MPRTKHLRRISGAITQRRRKSSILSQQNINVLRGSWKSICKISSNLNRSSSQHLPLKTEKLSENEIEQIRHTAMYQHIPKEIRETIDETKWAGAIHEGILQGGRKFRIWLAVPTGSASSSQLRLYLHYVTVWLQFASSIAKESCAEELFVYLILTDAKKLAPVNDETPIDVIHANTALTTSCSKQNEIFVFRREEWFKVFLHETFHCLGLDFSAMSFGPTGDPTNKCILSHFPALDPNTDVRLYETFCEMWAELFHLMFLLFSKGKCRPFSETQFIRALKKEQAFSLQQSHKILNRANLNYSDFFSEKDERMMYREKTQAFSYYVLKSVLLWHTDEFLNWCREYCAGSPAPIQFVEANAGKYCEMVVRLAKSEKYREVVGERICDSLNGTLRMTAESVEW